MATNPLAIPSQLIPPNDENASDRTTNAAAATRKPALLLRISEGINFIATTTSVSAPAIPANPLAIVAKLRLPIFSIASPNISIAAPKTVIPTAVEVTFFTLPVNLVNIATSANTAATPTKPLIIPAVSIPANLPTADANIVIAPARAINPRPLPKLTLSKSAIFKKAANSAHNTPTDINPLANSPILREPNSFTGFTNILIATANKIKPDVPFINPFSLLESCLATRTNVSDSAATPTTPLSNPSQSSSDNFLHALVNNKIAVDINIIVPAAFAVPVASIFPTALNIVNNSIISADIAAKATVNFCESTNDNATNEAVMIPIATAILINVFACISFCQASKHPFTPSRIPVILSRAPQTPSVIPLRLSMNFLIPTPIATRIPPFIKSNMPLKSALPSLSEMVSPNLPKALPIAVANPKNIGDNFFKKSHNPLNKLLNPLHKAVNGSNLILTLSIKLLMPLVSTFLNSEKNPLIFSRAPDILSVTLVNASPRDIPVSF